MPLVSVLMPTHNRADVIGDAIRSVLAQTLDDFELLVAGDGCTDNTAETVAGIDDKRIRWFDFDKGPGFGYANRNRALKEARGEFIAFAAHDDLLFPDHLALLVGRLRGEDGAGERDWAYSRPLWVSTDGVVVPFATNLELADELDFFMNVGNTIPASCVVHRRSCFEKAGYWPVDVERAADWHLWRRIISHTGRDRIAYLRTPTCLHFSADWKKSRHSLMGEVKRQLELADNEDWWPAQLRCEVKPGQSEQAAFFEAMTTGGPQWVDRLRAAVPTVLERIAWDDIRYTKPLVERQQAEIEARKQLAEEQQKEIRGLTAERDAARKQLEAMQASTIWRLTAPLRAIVNLAARLAGRKR